MSADFHRLFSGPEQEQPSAALASQQQQPPPPADSTTTAGAANTTSSAGPTVERRGTSRKGASLKTACQRCRSIKVRCQPQEPSNGKCVRCTRLNFTCEWVEPQKRGRKPAASRGSKSTEDAGSGESGRQPSPDSDSPLDNLALLAATANPQIGSSSAACPPTSLSSVDQPAVFSAFPSSSAHPFNPSPSLGSIHLPPTSYASQPEASTSQQPYTLPSIPAAFFPESAQLPTSLAPGYSPHASSTASGALGSAETPGSSVDSGGGRSMPSLSMVDLAQAKEAALQNLNSVESFPRPKAKQPAVVPMREPDVVDMLVLSELQAGQLFEHYHSKMNAFIILLDPFLHTVDYVRKNSTVLFTSILAVSAKFIRPDLYASLISTAKQLTGRSLIDGKVSVGLIQSILLQVYWKEPTDMTGWLRIGEAIRMGYQLHLHAPRTTPLPTDEQEAREMMDRERTWIDLCAFDQTFFLQGGDDDDGIHQTCMIPKFSLNVRSWLAETKIYGVVDDLEQGADFEWMKILRLSKDIARSRPANARSLADHVQGLLDDSYKRYLEPASPEAFTIGSRSWIRVNFWLAAASLAYSRAMLTALGIDSDTLGVWVVASAQFVDAFEIVAKHGYVSFWQDTLGVTLFAMGEHCVKIFPKIYPANQRAVLNWMERVYRACELSSDGRADSTGAFICRFFQACIRVVCSPTSSPEAAAAAAMSAGVAAIPPPPSNQQQQNQPPSAQVVPMETLDSSYWESLLPGLSTDWSWLDQPLDDLMRTT
ncbi:hypothetical protein JCM8097_008709 [Rhodosporidiobolus ruineniae]